MALFGAPRAFLGIDISTTTIKLVELVDRGHRIELATYALAKRPAQDDTKTMTATMSAMLEKAQVSADVVTFGLRGSQTFSTTLDVPKIPAADLDKVVRFKAKEYIPMDLSELTLTWVKQGQDETVRTHVTAIPKKVEQWYQEIAEELDLEIEALEPEVLAALRALNTRPNTGLICYADEQSRVVYQIQNGMPTASRTITLAKSEATESSSLKNEFHVALRQLNDVGAKQRITLIGDTSELEDVAEIIQKITGVNPEIADPWQDIVYPSELETAVVELGPDLTVAVGLAQRRLPHKIKSNG